jgi:integrase/recombinase XerD
MSSLPLIMKLDDWPEADILAWLSVLSENDMFDDSGLGARWSAGTCRKFAQSYGYWLAHLERSGQLDPESLPADRFTPEVVRHFHDDTRARVSFISTSSQLSDLYLIARALDPSRDWLWFKRITDKLRRDSAHRQLKPRLGLSSNDIYGWALSEIESADEMFDSGGWERPICFRDGLMVGLLIARPLRLRTFINIAIGQHLVRRNGGYELHFAPDDMKDRKARDFSIPAELVQPMDRYLSEFRPRLLGNNRTDKLWASRKGGALSYDGFGSHLRNITLEAFGIGLRPHAFRHVAATSIAEEDPAHVNIIAGVLGHATLTMSERHYNRATGIRATGAWQELIRAKRRNAAREERIRRQIDNHRAADSHCSEHVKE